MAMWWFQPNWKVWETGFFHQHNLKPPRRWLYGCMKLKGLKDPAVSFPNQSFQYVVQQGGGLVEGFRWILSNKKQQELNDQCFAKLIIYNQYTKGTLTFVPFLYALLACTEIHDLQLLWELNGTNVTLKSRFRIGKHIMCGSSQTPQYQRLSWIKPKSQSVNCWFLLHPHLIQRQVIPGMFFLAWICRVLA